MKTLGIPPLCEVCAIVSASKLNNEDTNGGDPQKSTTFELKKIITRTRVIDVTEVEFDQIECNTSIPMSVFKNLSRFCVHQSAASSSMDLLDYGVFTDEEGNRMYMYAIEIPYQANQKDDEKYENCLFPPYKLCFFSYHRLFNLMKNILQALFIVCGRNLNKQIDFEIQNLLMILSNVFIPPKGFLDVAFEYDKKTFLVESSIIHGLCDVPLALPFIYFNHKTIIEIIVSIITEQQVLFVGNEKATRVLIIECILAFIFPMEWIAPYLPVLTEDLYGFLGALGFFIFGADSNVLKEIEFYENIIVVNIDQGMISYGKGATFYKVDDSVVSLFEEQLPKKSFTYFGSSISRIYKNEEDIKSSKEQFDFILNSKIFISMQLLLLDLYKGLLSFQTSSNIKLNKTRRLSGYNIDQLTHLQLHLRKTMMRSSLKNKFNNPYLSRQYLNTFQNLQEKTVADSLIETLESIKRKEVILVCAETDQNLSAVEAKLSISDDMSVRSSLLYMKALLFLQTGKIIEAFQCVHKIFETSLLDFPTLEITKILKNIEREPDTYSKLMAQPFMKQAVWAPFSNDDCHGKPLINVSNNHTYTYLEVPEILLQIGITRKYEVARKIFLSLQSDANAEFINGGDLKKFCDIWKNMKFNLEHTFVPLLTGKEEKIVKVSKHIVDGESVLLLVGSTDKIYFFEKLSGHVCDFIKLSEIVKISISSEKLAFNLKSRKQKIVSDIKHGPMWSLIIEELIGAINHFERTKDHNTLVDARANILIFESLNEFDKKYGELIRHKEVIEKDSFKSNFFVTEHRHSEFLTFRKNLSEYHDYNDSAIASHNLNNDNILCRFSPNSGIKETIDVIISSGDELYIATRICNLYKVSSKSLEIEDHTSLMLTNNEKWSIFEMILIEECLWVSISYNKTEKSLCLIDCHEFSSFQILKLNHADNIVGMKNNRNYCYITSSDGFTSKWSIKEKICTSIVYIGDNFVLSTYINDDELLHSIKGGFSVLKEGVSANIIKTGFTLTKFIICNECIYGIDKGTPHVIRCFSLFNYEHITNMDVIGITIGPDTYSFSGLSHYQNSHLICATRDCSLLVYNIQQNCFVKIMKGDHTDLISSLTPTNDGMIITGARSKDGSIIFWINMFE